MKYLILGATGMAGHTISIYLQEQGNEVFNFSRKSTNLFEIDFLEDATDTDKLKSIVEENSFDVVVNCLGLLNQNAEDNKEMSVFINSYIPHFLSSITKETSTKIIHLSTDCVFSGKKGNYTENDFKDGETFYDKTKALGELVNSRDLTFRNSIIGPDINMNGIGLFNWFMKQNGSINGYKNAIWTGVTTLQLAKAIERASKSNLTGLYHLVNNSVITKFKMLELFNKLFNKNLIIKPIENKKIDKSLVNTRKDFDFAIPSYEEMFLEMKDWIYKHKSLYSHYYL